MGRVGLALLLFFASLATAAAQNPTQPANQPLAPAAPTKDIVGAREKWFYGQRAYPLKRIPPGARLRALRQLRRMEAAQPRASRTLHERIGGAITGALGSTQATTLSSTQWTLIGPQPTDNSLLGLPYSPVSGRVTALAVDPTNPDIVYLGSAEGGVWKTTDGGQHWTPLTDNQPSLAIGSIAVDPSNSQTIYVGTGEEDFAPDLPSGGDEYYGAGVLKSLDGGSTWMQLTGPFVGPYSSFSPADGGAFIGSIAVSPSNPQELLGAVQINNGGSSQYSGIYMSLNGGSSWTEVETSTIGPPTQVFFDPTNGSIAYASFYAFGVAKSTDGGLSWFAADGAGANALPSGNGVTGRYALAMDPRNTGTIYAGVGDPNSYALIGLYKTTDGGADWTQLPSTAFPYPPGYCSPGSPDPSQCQFDNVVAVDPSTSAVFVGGSAEGTPPGTAPIWESSDGGSTWSDTDPPPTSSGVQAVHPDVHAIAFAADGSKMYVGSDGGVWSTTNVTTSPVTWTNLNAPVALTQFYPGMSIFPSDANISLGGAQDNGVQAYSGAPVWQALLPGDGGYTALDAAQPVSTLYATGAANQGVYAFGFEPSPPQVVSPPRWAANGIGNCGSTQAVGCYSADFVAPLVLDPSNPQTLYFGTNVVYQSTDGANSWAPISPDLSGCGGCGTDFISAIAVAPADPNLVLAGSTDGAVSETYNATSGAGASWFDIGAGSGLPSRYVTAIAFDPKNATTAYVTFSGFSGFNTTPGHVFEMSSGTGWTDISGNLPNIPVNDIVVDPDIPNTLYIATDVGVFMTSDAGQGATWTPINNGLPSVVVMSLRLDDASRVLEAGTYGRSTWDLFVPANLPVADFSTPDVNFGDQLINMASAAQSVTLTNNGTVSMTVTGISIGGTNASDFAQTNTCPATLVAGANCTITLTFTPSSRGTIAANLQVADNAPASPQLVYLSGTGINPVASVSPTSLTFGNQNVGSTSAAQTIRLTDTGQDALIVSGVNITGAEAGDFKESDNCAGMQVQPSASCTVDVTFTPGGPLGRSATLTISDNAAVSPQTVSLSGIGVGPVASVSPSSASFGGEDVGSPSAAQTMTVSNTGNANLTISAAGISGPDAGDFAIGSSGTTCAANGTVAPQSSCAVSVVFTPGAGGSRTASLNITDNSDNASGSVQNVALAGTGEDFAVGLASGASSSASVSPGGTASYSLSVTPAGGFNQMVTLTCTGAPVEATCTVSPASMTLDGSSAVNFSVSVATTAPSLTPPLAPTPPLLPPAALWMLLLGLAAVTTLDERRFFGQPRSLRVIRHSSSVSALAALLLFMALWASCGGGGGGLPSTPSNPGTPAGTYTLTVAGTSGSLKNSVSLTLTVQ